MASTPTSPPQPFRTGHAWQNGRDSPHGRNKIPSCSCPAWVRATTTAGARFTCFTSTKVQILTPDSRVRPWNAAAWRYRSMGNYYDDMWAAAIEANPKVIAITSYNEWTEGTQIEAARSGRVSNRTVLTSLALLVQKYKC
jgi:hypothetical protein